MEDERKNGFENQNNGDSENRYPKYRNSYQGGGNGQQGERKMRPRFTRPAQEGASRSVRVERVSHSYGERPYGERPYGERSNERTYGSYNRANNYNNNYSRENSYHNRETGNYGNTERSNYGNGERSNYGNGERNNYGQRPQRSYRPSYNQNSDAQPRFYRERVQDSGENGNYNANSYNPNNYNSNNYGSAGRYQGNRQSRPYQGKGGVSYGRGANPARSEYGNNSYGNKQARPAKKENYKHQIQYREEMHDPDQELRLNKYLSNAGICSRREADDFITAGVVRVNGQIVTELGTKVKRGDVVLFHDQPVSIERKIYLLLNKPKDCVTTVDDPQERKTVMDYVKNACSERIYPVGRLDRNTTGVLLMTNDGELATRLMHPRFMKKKIYHVRLDRNVSQEDMQKLLNGVNIGDGDEVRADDVSYVDENRSEIGIEIHSGRNRVVRRMFDALGYRVTKLDRVQFAGLTKKRLRRGDWRFLTEKEVNMLRMGAYE